MFPGRLTAPLLFALATGVLLGTGGGQALDPECLKEMDAAIKLAVEEGAFPGAVLWVEGPGGLHHRGFGSRAVFPAVEPMTEDTIFDVASLTKVLATIPALMILQERGRVALDEPVAAYLPEFAGRGKEAITIRQLCTHTSGLARALSPEPDWYDVARAWQGLCAARLACEPGSKFAYSDLNFILLGRVIERLAGQRLDQFCAAEIFRPLGMFDTGFRPPPARASRIAPTEQIGRTVLRGTVHDPKAQAMGGVAGHAGLFTTAADMARFARMMLNGGTLDGTRLFTDETVRLMTGWQTVKALGVRRGLGWDIDSDFSAPRGERFPVGSSYGHTGFTGVSLWIDPASMSFWILLSNRIHPEPAGDLRPLQQRLGTLAAGAVHAGLSPGRTNRLSSGTTLEADDDN